MSGGPNGVFDKDNKDFVLGGYVGEEGCLMCFNKRYTLLRLSVKVKVFVLSFSECSIVVEGWTE